MKACPHNGWDLFAMTCFAFAYFAGDLDAVQHPTDFTDPVTVYFERADAETSKLFFNIQYEAEAEISGTGWTFIHHIDPNFIGQPDASRRTAFAGTYHSDPAGLATQNFSVDAAFPFSIEDTVHVLARHHRSSHGVLNYLLSRDAS